MAYRNDTDPSLPLVMQLRHGLEHGHIVTTGLICLELLRGFTRQTTRDEILRQFNDLMFIEPRRHDYSAAAELSIKCRQAGVQLGSVDALIAQICIANDLTLLTADADFAHAASHIPLNLWPTE